MLLQVWCIKDGSKECLPPGEIVKFHSSNCYIVLHSYTMDQKEEDFVYTWMSNQSTTVDIMLAEELAALLPHSISAWFCGNMSRACLTVSTPLSQETRATAADQAKDIASSFQRKAVEVGAKHWKSLKLKLLISAHLRTQLKLKRGTSNFLLWPAGMIGSNLSRQRTRSVSFPFWEAHPH